MLLHAMTSPRVALVSSMIGQILNEGQRGEIVNLVATLAYWRVIATRTRALRNVPADIRLSARNEKTVTMAMAQNEESRLLAPDEAAALAGPSFTAKRLYRLRGLMPEQAWVRKGGRLYFREGPYRRWLATR